MTGMPAFSWCDTPDSSLGSWSECPQLAFNGIMQACHVCYGQEQQASIFLEIAILNTYTALSITIVSLSLLTFLFLRYQIFKLRQLEFANVHIFLDGQCSVTWNCLKSSQNKKDLNDVTAARFPVSFSQLPAAEKHQKPGSCDIIKVLLIL